MSKFGEPTPCKKGCGKYIYFDRDSANGHPSADKWIPLEYNNDAGLRTDQPHQCPNKGKGTTIAAASNSKAETSETIIQLLKDIDGKLNRLLAIEGQ
ncbi:MAG: hypothetical protein WA941_13125 [Nitrososphaeraceae archaeon]